LTASQQSTDKFAASRQTNVGIAQVPDARLVKMRDLFTPKKFTPATVEDVDALVHVVRAFDDPELPHASGSVDPARDLLELELELILNDHELVERRIDRLAQSAKRGLKPEEEREKALLADVVLPAL